MMTAKEIGEILCPEAPGVYSPTTADVKLTFDDGGFLVGYFDYTERSEELVLENSPNDLAETSFFPCWGIG